jgi:hypothetical protein
MVAAWDHFLSNRRSTSRQDPCEGKGATRRGEPLLTSFLAVADADGVPDLLDSDADRNVALYEAFGFEVVGRQEIIGVDTRFTWRAGSALSG